MQQDDNAMEISGKRTKRDILETIVNIFYTPLGILPKQKKIQKFLPLYNTHKTTMNSGLLEGVAASYILYDLLFKTPPTDVGKLLELSIISVLGISGLDRMLKYSNQPSDEGVPSEYVNIPYKISKKIYRGIKNKIVSVKA